MKGYGKWTAMALLAAIWSASAFAQPEPTRIHRAIVLGPDERGECVVIGSPTVIRGAKRNNRVTWSVINQCQESVRVNVGNFKHRDRGNQRKNPLTLGGDVEVPGGAVGEIEGRVRVLPREDLGTYKYDILMNGAVAEDPELIIDE